jgi:uncharacterized damage-inducible protein DinB
MYEKYIKNMELKTLLLQEFDSEMAVARKMLERVPAELFTWKPHDKSMPMGTLAVHVAMLPSSATMVLETDFFDLKPGSRHSPEAKTAADLVAIFDEAAAKARTAIQKTDDEALMKPWEFRVNGTVSSTTPRAIAYRSFFMNHLIHHRAQLGVYLRLNDIAIPGSYGPSADEPRG